jgi:protein-disulfide isomerase
MKSVLATVVVLLSALPVAAQIAMPPTGATPFRDPSSLKPPAGAKVAIIEFEDLECFACAHASPIVRAAMSQYKIPRVHHDFLINSHIWSRTAAITARYLEDKVSPQMAEDFRRDVFVNQPLIASQDDLNAFSRKWFQTRGQQMPFVLDPSGRCAAEVQADCTLGERIGVHHTPTIIVVTAKEWIEVTDPNQLYAAVDRAELDAGVRAQTSSHK